MKYKSRGFETLWDLTIRCLIRYWKRTLVECIPTWCAWIQKYYKRTIYETYFKVYPCFSPTDLYDHPRLMKTPHIWLVLFSSIGFSLQRRNNERDGVSNHSRLECLLNRLLRRRSKKTSKLRVIGLCEGNSTVTGNSPHKGPVTRKMFPFDDVIIIKKQHTPG